MTAPIEQKNALDSNEMVVSPDTDEKGLLKEGVRCFVVWAPFVKSRAHIQSGFRQC